MSSRIEQQHWIFLMLHGILVGTGRKRGFRLQGTSHVSDFDGLACDESRTSIHIRQDSDLATTATGVLHQIEHTHVLHQKIDQHRENGFVGPARLCAPLKVLRRHRQHRTCFRCKPCSAHSNRLRDASRGGLLEGKLNTQER